MLNQKKLKNLQSSIDKLFNFLMDNTIKIRELDKALCIQGGTIDELKLSLKYLRAQNRALIKHLGLKMTIEPVNGYDKDFNERSLSSVGVKKIKN